MQLIFINFLFCINDICYDSSFILKISYIYSINIIYKYKRFLINKTRLIISYYLLVDIFKNFLINFYLGLLVYNKSKISVKINNLTILIKSILTWYKNIDRITILKSKKLLYIIQVLPSVLIIFLYCKYSIPYCYCRSAVERQVTQLITTVYESGNYIEIQNSINNLNTYKDVLVQQCENVSELKRRIQDKAQHVPRSSLGTYNTTDGIDLNNPKDYINNIIIIRKLPFLDQEFRDRYNLLDLVKDRVEVGQQKLEEDF